MCVGVYVCVCVCVVNIFKHLLLCNNGPIEAKFHVEPLLDGGTKVCSNGPGHITRTAAMPVDGKNLKKSSSPEPKVR